MSTPENTDVAKSITISIRSSHPQIGKTMASVIVAQALKEHLPNANVVVHTDTVADVYKKLSGMPATDLTRAMQEACTHHDTKFVIEDLNGSTHEAFTGAGGIAETISFNDIDNGFNE